MATVLSYLPWNPAPCTGGVREPCFLCPVCAENLFQAGDVKDHPCPHIPVVRDRAGSLLCWDEALRETVIHAWMAAAASGAATLDLLRDRLGPEFLFFDLLEPAPSPDRADRVTVVVDLRGAVPRAALCMAA